MLDLIHFLKHEAVDWGEKPTRLLLMFGDGPCEPSLLPTLWGP